MVTKKLFGALIQNDNFFLKCLTKYADIDRMRSNSRSALSFIFVVTLIVTTSFFSPDTLCAQDLSITSVDLNIEQGSDGGYHLYIKKKPGINSVLLTESTKDPAMQNDNYAFRTAAWNSVNGDEPRLIDGVFLSRNQGIWSLVDSSSEMHPKYGEVFHIYMPYILQYGYDWSRHGEIYVSNGTYFNIRAFELPYADYAGAFHDNSFMLEVAQSVNEKSTETNYMQDTVDAFSVIAAMSKGKNDEEGSLTRSLGGDDSVKVIQDILIRERGQGLDIVFCLDTTASMKKEIEAIKKYLSAIIRDESQFTFMRVGLVLYKDYGDEYVTRMYPFTNDIEYFQSNLMSIKVGGGKDIPEAVHEALFDAAAEFSWMQENRVVILLGDAPPHPRPKGVITQEIAETALMAQRIKVEAIILPQ
jgi:Mg-chelatase subunit ChlD